MGALPKRRISTHRKGKRRKNQQHGPVTLVKCPHCGAAKRPHFRCPKCGQ